MYMFRMIWMFLRSCNVHQEGDMDMTVNTMKPQKKEILQMAAFKAVELFLVMLFLSISVRPVLAGPEPLEGSEDVILTINGHEIQRDEYYSYMMPYKAKADDEDLWSRNGIEETNADILKNTDNDIRTNYRLLMWAEEEGLSPDAVTDEEYDSALKDETETAGGEEELKKQIRDNYMTEEVYQLRLRQGIVQKKLREYVYSDGSPYITPTEKDLKEIYEAYQFYTTKQILIFSSDDTKKDLEKRERAVAAIEELRAGTPFEDVMQKYNEDPNAMNTGTVYVAKSGDLFQEYENAARALKIDEVSEIVTSQVGYHIIKRVEPSMEDLNTQLGIYYENYKVNEKMNDLMYAETIVYGDEYAKLVPSEIQD